MRMQKLRWLCAALVSILPFDWMRCAGYRLFPGYIIRSGARVGLLAIIAVDRFELGQGATIGRRTRFLGPMAVTIGPRTFIGRWNEFDCPETAAIREKSHMGYARCITFGADCLVHEHHYFDIYGSITVGNGTWIAGRGSQFWTHGASVKDRDIHIGERCYLGSAIRVTPGLSLGNDIVVAMGSVLTGSLDASMAVVGGVPACLIRHRTCTNDFTFENWN